MVRLTFSKSGRHVSHGDNGLCTAVFRNRLPFHADDGESQIAQRYMQEPPQRFHACTALTACSQRFKIPFGSAMLTSFAVSQTCNAACSTLLLRTMATGSILILASGDCRESTSPTRDTRMVSRNVIAIFVLLGIGRNEQDSQGCLGTAIRRV